MSEDEDQSNSSYDSGSGQELDQESKNIEENNNSDDDSGSDDDASDKDASHSEGSSDEDGERNNKSASSSASSNENSRSDMDDNDEEKSVDGSSRSGSHGSHSRSRSHSPSRSRSRSNSEQSDNSELGGNVDGEEQDIKKLWERDPDFYGIRRSSRKRDSSESKPPKLHPQVEKRKAPPSKKVSRKRKRSSDDDDSSDEEVQRIVRKRGAQVVSYKENESEEDPNDFLSDDSRGDEKENGIPEKEEEHVETIERVMDHRIGKKGATGSSTTCYAVEERGDPNLSKALEDAEEERQFLIKWQGWSHLHNTWESLETLQEMKVKGLKKLDNYCKKEDDLSRWRSKANPEDIEYYECQLELQQELVKSYTNVERIIAENKGSDGQQEFYVKWECLPYADATWESGALIRKKNPEVIEIFKKRDASTCTPTTSAKSLRSRPKFTQIKSQPKYMASESSNLKLRDYQLDGVNWLVHSWCKDNSVILADEMGLGKTIQTICFLSYLFETHNLYGPFLIVVPLSTMAAWQREFAQWAPQINVVTYLGDISSRDIIREHEWFFKSNRRIKFNAILTTYEIVLKDKVFLSALNWAILMVDEAHRLKNDESLLYKTLCEFDTSHRLLITGTPLQNSLKELWSLLHFIMPHKFDDWESFEKEHDQAASKGYAKLHKQLEPYIIRRVKKDVEKSLPAKVEQILRVEMTMLQKQYYKWILTKNYNALRKGLKGSVSSFINVVMELKKCCNHATLVKPIENPLGDTLTTLIKGSGKLMLLDKLLVRLKETGHRVLIFSQMVRMLDIIAEYLQLRRFAFQRLDGSIKGDIRKQALDHFNAEGSTDFCFLLSTRAGGLGINLATADTVIIFDSDWNPQNDLQAQARAHRIGQKNQVNIYRLVTKSSVEEDIVEKAKRKMVLDHLVIQRMDTTGRTVLDKGSKSGTPFNKEELNAILKFGAEELFKEDENEGDDHCDIDEILRRAETHEDNAERPGDELLSAFKVASFAVNEDEEFENAPSSSSSIRPLQQLQDWESIIPEDLRKRVEEEEKEKEMADLYLPPRSSRAAAKENEENKEGGESLLGGNKKKQRKRKRQRDESEEDDDDSDGDGRRKKRGRPRLYGKKEVVKGLNDNQIRKFIKSFKRFAKPLLRIEKIAEDAGLLDKPMSELKKLGESLYQRCITSMAEAKANPLPPTPIKEEEPPTPTTNTTTIVPTPSLTTTTMNTPGGGGGGDASSLSPFGGTNSNLNTTPLLLSGTNPDGTTTTSTIPKIPKKPREKAPVFTIAGVQVNAKTFSNSLEELEPLGEAIPRDENARKSWKFDLPTKAHGYDVEWGPEEDTKLLLGVYEYGYGAWKLIAESDPVLKEKVIIDNIDPENPNKKPQLKHIHSRTEHLIKVLRKHQLSNKKLTKPRKKKENTKKKEKLDGMMMGQDENNSGINNLGISTLSNSIDGIIKDSEHHHHHHHHGKEGKGAGKGGGGGKDGKAARAKKKKDAGPMHFTAHAEPTSLNVLGDLDPVIFNECKEKMRPVKKALKALDRADPSLSEKEQIKQTRDCLLQIGDQITTCLDGITDPVELKKSKTNLWYFVSKFTEYDAGKLYKLYKSARKTREKEEGKEVKKKKHDKEKKEKKHDKDKDKSLASSSTTSKMEKESSSSTTTTITIKKERHKEKDSSSSSRDKNDSSSRDKNDSFHRNHHHVRDRDRDNDKKGDRDSSSRSSSSKFERDRFDRDRNREWDRGSTVGGSSNMDRNDRQSISEDSNSRGAYERLPGELRVAPPQQQPLPTSSSASSFSTERDRNDRLSDPRGRGNNSSDLRGEYDRVPGDPRDRSGWNNRHHFDRNSSSSSNNNDRSSWSDRSPNPRGGGRQWNNQNSSSNSKRNWSSSASSVSSVAGSHYTAGGAPVQPPVRRDTGQPPPPPYYSGTGRP